MSNRSYPMVDLSLVGRLNSFKDKVDAIPARVADAVDSVSYKKVGGLHFLKVGAYNISWSRKRRSIVAPKPKAIETAEPASAIPEDVLAARVAMFIR